LGIDRRGCVPNSNIKEIMRRVGGFIYMWGVPMAIALGIGITLALAVLFSEPPK